MRDKRKLILGLATALSLTLAGCSELNRKPHAQVTSGPEVSLCVGDESETSRLFLQQVTRNSAIIKWRGEATQLCFGTSPTGMNQLLEATQTEGEHKEVLLTGLAANTTYYYSIGAAPSSPVGQRFTSAPEKGSLPADGNTRIWLIGDSGTGSDDEREKHAGEAAQVRDGMLSFVERSGGEPVDLFLMLGDNAYSVGSDFNYQQAVFETYPNLLKSTSVWPTIGNHEMGAGQLDMCAFAAIACGKSFLFTGGVSSTSDPKQWFEEEGSKATLMPYLSIFTLPQAAQAGGVASGTEQYYSFDYGNVHVVSLDSQLSARDATQRAAMRQWLTDDLSSNTLDWTVVIFHHPPYSKGANHDSDDTQSSPFDRPVWDMRNEFVPVFEEHGVDVVYSGHSHSYERSYYLQGHLGTSDTFSAQEHAELLNGNVNHPSLGHGDAPYAQLSATSGGIDDRVVYTVAGSSGKADTKSGGTTTSKEWLRHPAHVPQEADTIANKRHGLPVIGSVIIDAGQSELAAKFIDANGAVLDHFVITR